jgi:hypothetical protein
MTSLSTNIDELFLKDRILRLWNLTASSTRATIATQSPGGEGHLMVVMEKKMLIFIFSLLLKKGLRAIFHPDDP